MSARPPFKRREAARAPVCSVLTGRAPSGLAVVLLRGRGAGDVLAKTFRRPSGRGLPGRDRAAYGLICCSGAPVDEVLAVRTEKPPEEGFEICCHGGTAAARAVVDAFTSCGAAEVAWTSLFRAGTLEYDLVRYLLSAEGEGQARTLAHLMSGPLRNIFAKVAVALDRGLPEGRKAAFLERLRTLRETLDVGRILTEPPLAVITGSPNAGKSTLFNAILGESRALTSRFPGTTRDPVEAVFLLAGFPVRLADTAGAGTAGLDPLTAGSLSAAERLTESCALEIRLAEWEPGRPLVECDAVFTDGIERGRNRNGSGRMVIHILNKSDILDRKTRHSLPGDILAVSALRGTGLRRLLVAMRDCLGISRLANRLGAVLLNSRQADLVEAAIDALRTGRNRTAVLGSFRQYLGQPTD